MNKWLIAGAIVAFGISAFLRKLAVDRMHPYNMQIVAALIYMSCIPIWMHLAPKDAVGINFHGSMLTLATILLHIFGSVAFGLLLKSSNSTGALAVMISASPLITTALSIAFLKEEFGFKQIIATLLTLIGLTLFNMK